MPNEAISATVVLRDGATLAYTVRRSGVAAAPRLVLIHTLAMDRTIWAPLVNLLPEVDVLTYDVRGHGASTTSPGPYSGSQLADDLADLLRAAGWERAIVLGASMGGSIAIQFAIDHPQMVRALGLVDTTAWYGETAPADWAGRAEKARSDGFGAMIGFQLGRWFTDPFRASHHVTQMTTEIFLRNDIDAYVAACDFLGHFDARAGLGTIAAPTEVLVGADDYATPVAMSEALAAAIPGANLTVLPGLRHLTILEVPERIAGLVRTLVERSQVVA
jgi:3-oxoadipate enol-lactonase